MGKIRSIAFFSALILTVLQLSAQVEKGRLSFGASPISIEYRKDKLDNIKSKSFIADVNLGIGRFLQDGLLFGMNLRGLHGNGNTVFAPPQDSKTEFRQLDISFGPYLEYYLGKSSNGRPFVSINPSVSYFIDKSTFTNYSPDLVVTESRRSNFGFSGMTTAGYAVFLNNSFILKLIGGYSFTFNSSKYIEPDLPKNNASQNRFFLGIGILATFAKSN